jgi:hypothetical protein
MGTGEAAVVYFLFAGIADICKLTINWVYTLTHTQFHFRSSTSTRPFTFHKVTPHSHTLSQILIILEFFLEDSYPRLILLRVASFFLR